MNNPWPRGTCNPLILPDFHDPNYPYVPTVLLTQLTSSVSYICPLIYTSNSHAPLLIHCKITNLVKFNSTYSDMYICTEESRRKTHTHTPYVIYHSGFSLLHLSPSYTLYILLTMFFNAYFTLFLLIFYYILVVSSFYSFRMWAPWGQVFPLWFYLLLYLQQQGHGRDIIGATSIIVE